MESLVERIYHLGPLLAAFGYFVELLFHICREVVVKNAGELLFQIVVHEHAYVSGGESADLLADLLARRLFDDFAFFQRKHRVFALYSVLVLLDDVSAVDDSGYCRGVCGRAADAEFFETLYEHGLVVAGR